MNKGLRILLIVIAVACFAVALSYPIRYRVEEQRTEDVMDQLIAMRDAGVARGQGPTRNPIAQNDIDDDSAEPSGGDNADSAEAPDQMAGEPAEAEPGQAGEAGQAQAALEGEVASQNGAAEQSGSVDTLISGTQPPESGESAAPGARITPAPTPTPTPTPVPTPTINRFERTGPLTYPEKEKVTLDVDKILPQYQEIYASNNDFAGWITIPGTIIDYPVVQCEDSEFYLHNDFYGNKNANGQIILDTLCDPYTPSYNLVISGHSMRSGKMFGRLVDYMYKSYWQKHKFVYFDTLMEQKEYVVFAAFFSADYDEDEEGFRYNADIQYAIDAKQWLREIRENQVYDTEIDVGFGDEFLTLTTCNKAKRKDGRFVVVCRRIREGEIFE